MSVNAKVHKSQDPDKITVESGGEIEVKSGGKITVETGGTIEVNSVELDATELGVLNVVAGTVTASKAVVVDSNKDAGDFRNIDVTNLDAGASGTAGTVDVFPSTASKGKLIISANDNTGDTNVIITNAEHGQATTVTIPDSGLPTSYVAQSTNALEVDELDQLDLSLVGARKKYVKSALTIAANATANDTTIVLPARCVVTGAYIDVQTAEVTGATKTINIGIKSGDEDGYLVGIDVSSIGLKKGTLSNGAQTLGALLSVDEDGAGTLVPEGDVANGGATVVYTFGSDDFSELVANVIVEYIEIA